MNNLPVKRPRSSNDINEAVELITILSNHIEMLTREIKAAKAQKQVVINFLQRESSNEDEDVVEQKRPQGPQGPGGI